ncbi:TPA: NAD-dependent epimerase/dehydratase family protein, partial [Citrobacter freundii]
MKLLLTGVTGFIGKKVAEKLVRGGHEIHALVRKLPDDSFFTAGDIHYHVIAESSIKEIVSEVKPDVVIHIASMFLAEHHHGDIEDLINSNVTFPTQLLDAMSLVGVNNFINT